MILRAARPDDVPRLAPLWRAAWLDGHVGHVPDELMAVRGPEHFEVHAEKYAPSTVVAVDAEDRLLGLIILGDDDGEVVQLAVDRSARGGGASAGRCCEPRRSGSRGGTPRRGSRSCRATRGRAASTSSTDGATRGR
ncbi:hypothetical protein LUX33_24080 [Actinomadura madurae]|nr:hypothetical protein [Actinomadura madurae]MCP9951195.1 hypothetical protein [Actinomadura madurae]